MSLLSRIGNIFRRPKPPEPTPQPSPEDQGPSRYAFQKRDEGLAPQVQTLDEFYAASHAQFEAEDMLRGVEFARELLTRDQSSLDQDSRAEYVSLPEQNFQASPEAGYHHSQGHFEVRGTSDGSALVTSSESESQGQWNPETGTFTLSTRQGPQGAPDYLGGPKQKVADQTFKYQAGQGIESSPENQKVAARAERILQSVESWEKASRQLDGSPQDFNPRPEQVVAAHREAPEGESILSKTFAWSGPAMEERLPFSGFDVEAAPGFLKVNGSFGNGPAYGSSLESYRDENTLRAVVSRPEFGIIEKVVWNISEATLHYEKLKKG